MTPRAQLIHLALRYVPIKNRADIEKIDRLLNTEDPELNDDLRALVLAGIPHAIELGDLTFIGGKALLDFEKELQNA